MRHEELARQLRRELDWIPLKAMRKDRTQRYRTATDLADDIHNYLNGDPLEAGPESATYRLKKLLIRNKGPVVAVAAVMVVLLAGFIGVSLALAEATRQRSQAVAATEREAETRQLQQHLQAATIAKLQPVLSQAARAARDRHDRTCASPPCFIT